MRLVSNEPTKLLNCSSAPKFARHSFGLVSSGLLGSRKTEQHRGRSIVDRRNDRWRSEGHEDCCNLAESGNDDVPISGFLDAIKLYLHVQQGQKLTSVPPFE